MIDLTGYTLKFDADGVVTVCTPPQGVTDIPYRSQWDPDAAHNRNDCGPACVAMVLQSRGVATRIDDLANFVDAADDGTTSTDLLALFKRFSSVKAKPWTGLDYPPFPAICLVHYAGFQRANVQDVNYQGWHWLIVLRVVADVAICHDPNFWGDRRNEGALKRYSKAELDAAFAPYGSAKVAVVWE